MCIYLYIYTYTTYTLHTTHARHPEDAEGAHGRAINRLSTGRFVPLSIYIEFRLLVEL